MKIDIIDAVLLSHAVSRFEKDALQNEVLIRIRINRVTLGVGFNQARDPVA